MTPIVHTIDKKPGDRLAVVFCGSSTGKSPVYMQDARRIGELLAENGYRMLYGGGVSGLMGAVARGAVRAGGEVIGVMPPGFEKPGSYELPPGVTELAVDHLMDRKKLLMDAADVVIVLPGGIGTLDEFWEPAAKHDLTMHFNPGAPFIPTMILNTNGFYDGTRDQFSRAQREGFIKPGRENLYKFFNQPDHLIREINAHFAEQAPAVKAAPRCG